MNAEGFYERNVRSQLLRPERTRSAYLAAHPPRRQPFPHESHVDFGAMDRVFNRARSEAVRV